MWCFAYNTSSVVVFPQVEMHAEARVVIKTPRTGQSITPDKALITLQLAELFKTLFMKPGLHSAKRLSEAF